MRGPPTMHTQLRITNEIAIHTPISQDTILNRRMEWAVTLYKYAGVRQTLSKKGL